MPTNAHQLVIALVTANATEDWDAFNALLPEALEYPLDVIQALLGLVNGLLPIVAAHMDASVADALEGLGIGIAQLNETDDE